MKRLSFILGLTFVVSIIPCISFANTESVISISPTAIIQGDPVLVTINATSTPTKIIFDGRNIPVFTYLEKQRALIPIDINRDAGTYDIEVIFQSGEKITKSIVVDERKKIEAPLGIPAKLGGNTNIAATNVVINLTEENKVLNTMKTFPKALWTKTFLPPLKNLIITDAYGYNRKTGEYTIPHKGTDFHASLGTKVYAMNRGIVRIAHTFTIYGKTIALDHGLGLQTFYMHLSKIYVNEGELVRAGQLIGLSGKTGYAEAPHLHLSIKINGISIDPVIFFKFFEL